MQTEVEWYPTKGKRYILTYKAPPSSHKPLKVNSKNEINANIRVKTKTEGSNLEFQEKVNQNRRPQKLYQQNQVIALFSTIL